MELTDDIFKHFRIFLKVNNLYADFMECFRTQKYEWSHEIFINELVPNFIRIMKNYAASGRSGYEEFGAMIITFGAFNWANGNSIPISFTRRWCTTCLKWGLYCFERKIKICQLHKLQFLMKYWNSNSWIDPYMLDTKEMTFIKERFAIRRVCEVDI